jgi:hypothetical protein
VDREFDLKVIDEGENFRLCTWQSVAYCQVWARPDVSAEDGARFAAILMNSLRFLLTDENNQVPGIVFDLRQAPKHAGPKTLAHLGEAITTWSLAGKNVIMLVDPQAPEQRAQMLTLVQQSGNGIGAVHDDVDAALCAARIHR